MLIGTGAPEMRERGRAAKMEAMPVEHVDSLDDPRLAPYRAVRDADLRRADDGVFVAESSLVVLRLLRSTWGVRSVLAVPRTVERVVGAAAARACPVYVVDEALCAQLVGYALHRGVLALGERRPEPSPHDLLASGTHLAVLEGLNDHENLGTLFRSAAALGVGGIALDRRCADPLYRRCVRVSMGAVLSVPFARVGEPAAWCGELRAAGYTVVALTPDADAAPIEEASTPRPARVALVLGAEGPGLSAGLMAAADVRVRIPMAAGADSLNVAMAAAVAFHRFCAPPG